MSYRTLNGFKPSRLSEKEVEAYKENKATSRKIRKELLKAFPEFDYIRVYTEPRAGGRCMSKFWLTNLTKEEIGKHILWITERYSNELVGIRWSEYTPFTTRVSLAITVGK